MINQEVKIITWYLRMDKYTERLIWETRMSGYDIPTSKKVLTKEQEVELAYEELEKCKRDAIMEAEMGLDL